MTMKRLLNEVSRSQPQGPRLTIPRWLEETYDAGSRPTARTVRNWINSGLLDAERHGRTWYVRKGALPRSVA